MEEKRTGPQPRVVDEWPIGDDMFARLVFTGAIDGYLLEVKSANVNAEIFTHGDWSSAARPLRLERQLQIVAERLKCRIAVP